MYKSVSLSVRCRQDLALRQLESVGPTGLAPSRLNAGGSDFDLALRQLQDQTDTGTPGCSRWASFLSLFTITTRRDAQCFSAGATVQGPMRTDGTGRMCRSF